MFRATIHLDDDVILAIRESAQQAPARVKRFVGTLARGTDAQEMVRELAAEPPKPRYPIRWKSERQRRYVLAKLRRENNLPYKRTGRTRRAWQVVVDNAREASIAVVNNERAAEFVNGRFQQTFHGDTGWPAAEPIIRRYSIVFQNRLVDFWYKMTGAK